MQALVILALFASCASLQADFPRTSNRYMSCSGTTLCGVLTIESGFGSGYYKHPAPEVHGLWPEVGGYGSSACVTPADKTAPAVIFPCYKGPRGSEAHQLEFQQHEWTTHGICSGVRNATDYFTQICRLSQAPLAVMATTRASGATSTSDFAAALTKAGYSVWDLMDEGQVELSACAGRDGNWRLGAVTDFSRLCGPGPPAPSPSPAGQCIPNVRGPPCKVNSDCLDKPRCVRCSHHGFCTDIPIE